MLDLQKKPVTVTASTQKENNEKSMCFFDLIAPLIIMDYL